MARAFPTCEDTVDSFDIDDFEDLSQADVTIKNPVTGAPTGVVITLAGPEHPARKRILFDRQRRLRAGLQKTGRLQLGDPEDDEQDELDMLIAATLGWSGVRRGGADVPCSAQAARDLYADPKRRWLRDQVKTALDEREAFIQRSAAT